MGDRRDALMKLFSAKGVKVNTNRGESYYKNLYKKMEDRLNELERSEAASRMDIHAVLKSEG